MAHVVQLSLYMYKEVYNRVTAGLVEKKNDGAQE